MKNYPSTQASRARLEHLRDILKILSDEEARDAIMLMCSAIEPTADERKYAAQFRATKLAVLKAIELCAAEIRVSSVKIRG